MRPPTGLPALWERLLQPHDLRVPAPSQHTLSAANRAVSAWRYAGLLDQPWTPELAGTTEPEPEMSDGEMNEARRNRSPDERATPDTREAAWHDRTAQAATSVYDITTGRQCERTRRARTGVAHDPTATLAAQEANTARQERRLRGRNPGSAGAWGSGAHAGPRPAGYGRPRLAHQVPT